MIEVEAKVKISNPVEIRKKISKIAKYLGIVKKVDDYYTLENAGKFPHKSIRIRRKKNSFEVNIKKKLVGNGRVNVKQEIELIVKDPEAFEDVIKDFGFRRWLRKEKVTYNYEIGKRFHIELNNVKHLGWFLEVEYLAKKKEVPMAREKVLEVLKRLGHNPNEIIESGYTRMLWEIGKVN